MKNTLHTRARGSTLIYALILMTVMLAMTSFAVDYGHRTIIRSELQRSADAMALGCIQFWVKAGANSSAFNNYLASNAVQPIINADNPSDGNSHIAATYTISYGYWNTVTQSFVATGNSNSTPFAVQVQFQRTAATGNAVPFTFPLISSNGKSPIRLSMDVVATATAVDFGGQTASPTVGGQSDPWLAGMSAPATASDQDSVTGGQSPTFVMNVVPGTYISVTNVSGAVKHDPALSSDPATGDGNGAVPHMFDDSNGTAVQNGIGDIVAPLDSLIGVFLKSNSPDQNAAPTVVRDYSTSASMDNPSYNDITAQQPFYIGTGKTSGGTVQTFRVPPGCTRLYMGPMDGHQWANNSGSFSANVTQSQDIQLVQ